MESPHGWLLTFYFFLLPPSPAAVQEERQRGKDKDGDGEGAGGAPEEMPVDRILEAELAVEQKSDQGVEGPGGTAGSGSSVSAGVNLLFFLMGVGRWESRSVLSSPPLPPPHNPSNTAGDRKCRQTRSLRHLR